MFGNRPLVRALTLAFLGAVTVLPATAMADSTSPNGAPTEAGRKHKDKDKTPPVFPMDAKAFRDLVEKHIEHARVHMNKQMEKHKVPAATQAEIKKRFEEATKQIRTAVDHVAADGTVTQDEAKEVRHLSQDLKRKALASLHGDKKRARK